MRFKTLMRNQETYIFLIIVFLCAVITIINPKFATFGNIFSVLKSTIIYGLLSMGVLIVIISGGIDISFPVVAAFCMYTSSLIFKTMPEIPVAPVIAAGMCIGLLCGMFNGLFIALYNFPAMVVTLGTSGALAGFMYTFIGTKINHNIPPSLIEFGKANIFTVTPQNNIEAGIPAAYLLYLFVALAIYLVLKYTSFGRSIYAVGGDEVSAGRIGLNTKKTKFFVYSIVGMIAGLAGVIHISFLRMANPFDLYGSELLVIAATILGGATIGGGRGSVIGTIMGIFLITVVNNSLILLGVPSYWQKVVVGIIIICAISIPPFIRKRMSPPKNV